MKMFFILIFLGLHVNAGIISWMSPAMQTAATAINQVISVEMSLINQNLQTNKATNIESIKTLNSTNKTHIDKILASQYNNNLLLQKRYENNKKIQKLFLGEK